MQNNNNHAAARKVAGMLRDAAAVGAAATSVFVIASIAYGSFIDLFTYWPIAGLATVAVIAAVLTIIDLGLRQFFPFWLDLAVSGQMFSNWRTILFGSMLLGLIIFQAFSSATLSWMGRQDVAEVVVKEPETTDVADLKLTLEQSSAGKIGAIQEDLRAIRQDIRETEKAIEANNGKLVTLARDGNGWAQSKLSKLKDSATRNARKNLDAKEALLTDLQRQESEILTATLSGAVAENETKVSRYQEVRQRNENYAGYFGVSCTGVFLLLSMLLALWPEEGETTATPQRETPKRSSTTPRPQRTETPPVAVAERTVVTPFATGRNGATGEAQRNGATQRSETGNVSAQLSTARANLRAYRSKEKRGDGNPETIQAGLQRWAAEVERLENMA